MAQLIGREKEIQELDRCMTSGQSEFVTICGRRRVGKTFLVEQYFEGKYAFSYVGGHKLTNSEQLQNFAWALQNIADLPMLPNCRRGLRLSTHLNYYLKTHRNRERWFSLTKCPGSTHRNRNL